MTRRAVDIKTGTEGHFWSDILEPIKQVGRQIMELISPSAEASEVADAYEISVELPGVRSEDIEVSITDGILTVRGEKHSEREEKGRSYYFSERSFGAFQRAFRLPSDANVDAISADSEHGVLTIRVPRLPVEKRPERKIKIRSSDGGKAGVETTAKTGPKTGTKSGTKTGTKTRAKASAAAGPKGKPGKSA